MGEHEDMPGEDIEQHDHAHDHSYGHDHSHGHDHGHSHDHGHGHHHDHGQAGAGPDRTQALLSYMVGHNKSHAEEMRECASALEGEAAALVNEAADLLDQGNAKLEAALALL